MSKLYIDESSYDDIQAILFDKDGTIIDFMVWIHWLEAFLNFLDSVVSVPYHKSFVRHSLGVSANYRSWDSTGAFAMGTSQDLFTIVSLAFYQQGLPWEQAYQTVLETHQKFEKTFAYSHYMEPVKGLPAFLQQAKELNIPMGVVTSDNQEQAVQHLELIGLTTHFTSVVGADMVNRGKPFPDMVYLACQQLEAPLEKTIIFGDSNGDMLLGKHSGLLGGIGVLSQAYISDKHLRDAEYIIKDYRSVALHKM
ncbi:MAG TPA: HAD-IA family hydrolase [Virgibacillus sp.]|nr:HAD-IA family hydrolase [Virgibacillus sp.]